jgi:hypothetical protein
MTVNKEGRAPCGIPSFHTSWNRALELSLLSLSHTFLLKEWSFCEQIEAVEGMHTYFAQQIHLVLSRKLRP